MNFRVFFLHVWPILLTDTPEALYSEEVSATAEPGIIGIASIDATAVLIAVVFTLPDALMRNRSPSKVPHGHRAEADNPARTADPLDPEPSACTERQPG